MNDTDVITEAIEERETAQPKRVAVSRAFFVYLAVYALFAASTAFLAGRLIAPSAARDVFASVGGAYDAAKTAGKLLLPTLSAFLLTYLFAFSPFAIPSSLAAIALHSVYATASFSALICQGTSAKNMTAAVFLSLCALFHATFAARCCELSPAARAVRFSSFEGRREAAAITRSFFTLSGAAAIFHTACALILHFA